MMTVDLSPPIHKNFFPDVNGNYLQANWKNVILNETPKHDRIKELLRSNSAPARHVRFADSFGLQLSTVRIITESPDDPPRLEKHTGGGYHSKPDRHLTLNPQFSQPMINFDLFMKRVDSQSVCLESVSICGRTLRGVVKVVNLAFEKAVRIKYTMDLDWKTAQSLDCSYLDNSLHTSTKYDSFEFVMELPPTAQYFEFCISYESMGQIYWDNNNASNYRLC